MSSNKTLKKVSHNGRNYHLLTLPDSNYFKITVINKHGSDLERVYKNKTGKNVYGISHFIEHLSFRSPKDYSTPELYEKLKNLGEYNASTNTSEIMYYFETTMDNAEEATNLVANIAYNTLESIPEDEFTKERDVIINEANRYFDDSQTSFWFNLEVATCGLDKGDNVIGDPEVLATFDLDTCVEIKDIMLRSGEEHITCIYDPSLITEGELLDMIDNEFNRFKPLNSSTIDITQNDILKYRKYPQQGIFKQDTDGEQSMTAILIEMNVHFFIRKIANEYLGYYAEDTSLTDIIREQNGLTYGISFSDTEVQNKHYTYFGCDVSKGNEELLLKLFKESIQQTLDNFTPEAFDKFINTKRMKETMEYLNLKTYRTWFTPSINYKEFNEYRSFFEEDIKLGIDKLYGYTTFIKVKEYMKTLNEKIQNNDYSMSTTY